MRNTAGAMGDPPPPAAVARFRYTCDNVPTGSLTTNGTDLAFVVKFLADDLSLLPGSAIYVDGPTSLPRLAVDLTQLPYPGGPQPIAHDISGLPYFQYALTGSGEVVLNAWVGDTLIHHGIWYVPVGAAPILIASDEGTEAPGREPLTTLRPNVEIVDLGPMVVSSSGSIAFMATLLDQTDPDENLEPALLGINRRRELVLLSLIGDPLDLSVGRFSIDLLDMLSGEILSPSLSVGIELRGTRDHHVAFGSGRDGRGTSTTIEGCGEVLYRARANSVLSESVPMRHAIPGMCP